jgi:glycosyltransferase involved in cell wall biosynthesis
MNLIRAITEQATVYMKDSLVSLIIPAYNEEKTIARVLVDTSEVMQSLAVPYEILVIDDGSTDNTEFAILTSKVKAKFFSNELNMGKGYCIRRGVEHAKGEIIVTLDSDGEHQPKEIPDLLAPLLEGVDIVAGSRFLGNAQNVTTKLNQVGNYFFNLAIMLLTGKQVSDSQTGFRAMKRSIFQKLNLRSDGYEIETEITVKSLMNGFTFKEVPVTVERRKYNVSKIKVLSDGGKILTTIIRSSFASIEH